MAVDKLFPQPDKYLYDPVAWAEEKLGMFLWSVQKQIMESVRDNRMTAVKSCHGPGKSFTASSTAGWWIDAHPLGSAFALTTAPSWPQVQTILWREIRRRYVEGHLPGRITLDCQWHLGREGSKRGAEDEEIVAMGRKPADYDQHTLQGLHARYFLAILDEAGGIDEFLWNAVLALVTNENARVLAIGNPDDPNSRFAQICEPGSGWNVITIPVWETPLFPQEVCDELGFGWVRTIPPEEVPPEVAEGLVSPMWVLDRVKDYGVGSPIWVSKIEGEFPDVSDEYLISPSLVRQCINRDLPGFEIGRYGLDVARMGTDKSALYRNRGGVIRRVAVWAKQDTMQSAGRAAMVFNAHGANQVPCTIDIIGLGAGVFDRLRELGFQVAPHQGSQSALNKLKFYNRRSEVYWTFREMMERGEIDLDADDDQLHAQLTSIKWTIADSTGKIKVETKEDMAKRGMPSPDLADAAVLSTVAAASVPDPSTWGKELDDLVGDLLSKRM